MTRGFLCDVCGGFYTGKPGGEFTLHTQNPEDGRPLDINAEFCAECADGEAARYGVLPTITTDDEDEDV